MNGDLRTPLARARGLGSARAGVGHWWMQQDPARGAQALKTFLADLG